MKQRLTTPMLRWSLAHNSSLTRDNILHLHSPFQKKGSLYRTWKDFLKTINKLWAGASPRHVWFTSFIIFTYRLIELYYILPVSLNRSPNCSFIVLKQVKHFTQLVVCYETRNKQETKKKTVQKKNAAFRTSGSVAKRESRKHLHFQNPIFNFYLVR